MNHISASWLTKNLLEKILFSQKGLREFIWYYGNEIINISKIVGKSVFFRFMFQLTPNSHQYGLFKFPLYVNIYPSNRNKRFSFILHVLTWLFLHLPWYEPYYPKILWRSTLHEIRLTNQCNIYLFIYLFFLSFC